MEKKKVFSSELAYILGLIALAIGTGFMERANFGMSMVVAPAYLIHLKLSQIVPWFSFGVAEYCFQAFLLILMALLLRRFRITYLFSFCTAVIYGTILDLMIGLVAMISFSGMIARVVYYLLGMVVCAVGVSLLFNTYISPEAYELFVKEISQKYNKKIEIVKSVYDCTSCLISVILSFVFFGFGHFESVKWGTIICALINGTLIGFCTRGFNSIFRFKDSFAFRRYFENQ